MKGVSTNRLTRSFQQQLPTVPVVYIVRHPLLVVGSYSKMSWLTPKEPAHWLKQEKLMADHLAPFKPVIESADSPLKQSACICCLLNYVPQRQSHSRNWTQVSYEELLAEPHRVLSSVSTQLGMWEEGLRWKRIEVPSHTAESSVADRASRTDKWRAHVSESDRRDVERYVGKFGFDEYLTPVTKAEEAAC